MWPRALPIRNVAIAHDFLCFLNMPQCEKHFQHEMRDIKIVILYEIKSEWAAVSNRKERRVVIHCKCDFNSIYDQSSNAYPLELCVIIDHSDVFLCTLSLFIQYALSYHISNRLLYFRLGFILPYNIRCPNYANLPLN